MGEFSVGLIRSFVCLFPLSRGIITVWTNNNMQSLPVPNRGVGSCGHGQNYTANRIVGSLWLDVGKSPSSGHWWHTHFHPSDLSSIGKLPLSWQPPPNGWVVFKCFFIPSSSIRHLSIFSPIVYVIFVRSIEIWSSVEKKHSHSTNLSSRRPSAHLEGGSTIASPVGVPKVITSHPSQLHFPENGCHV